MQNLNLNLNLNSNSMVAFAILASFFIGLDFIAIFFQHFISRAIFQTQMNYCYYCYRIQFWQLSM